MRCGPRAHRSSSNSKKVYELVLEALKDEPDIKAKAKGRMRTGKKLDPVQKSAQGKARDELASIAGVSHDTVEKVFFGKNFFRRSWAKNSDFGRARSGQYLIERQNSPDSRTFFPKG